MTATIDPWRHANPVELHCGPGVARQALGERRPGRLLVVTTAGLRARGTLDAILGDVPDSELSIHDAITPNPDIGDLEPLVDRYRDAGISTVFGIGGGSALDAAKIIAVGLDAEGEAPLAAVFREGRTAAWQRNVALLAAPTTAGTGAEVTPFATLWDHERQKKYSVSGPAVFPDRAILDPTLTLSLPPEQTLFTGLDATSHALESLWNVNRTPTSELFAQRALELIAAAFPVVLERPDDLGARADMQLASAFAGLAISQTRTALAHAISYAFTLRHDVPHGLACSFTLPALIDVHLQRLPAAASERVLLERIKALLDSLRLPERLRAFAGEDEIRALLAQPVDTDRGSNYLHRDVRPESLAGQ